MAKWRPVESVIKDQTKTYDRMLVKDQHGTVFIGAWSGFHKAWMIEGEHMAAGARFDVCQRLPK
jgi:hypothetical protein